MAMKTLRIPYEVAGRGFRALKVGVFRGLELLVVVLVEPQLLR